MILKERAIDAGAVSGAALLVVASWWLAGQLHDHPAAAPIARPASTVTVTSPVPVAGPTGVRTVTPAPRTSGPSPAPEVLSAADRTTAMPHTSSGGTSHVQGRQPSAPSPSPAAACDGGVLSVQALRALCVSIGGNR